MQKQVHMRNLPCVIALVAYSSRGRLRARSTRVVGNICLVTRYITGQRQPRNLEKKSVIETCMIRPINGT
jgi:hypothetical protein